jgi:hypothetical protein
MTAARSIEEIPETGRGGSRAQNRITRNDAQPLLELSPEIQFKAL